jgi:hypothetical protein
MIVNCRYFVHFYGTGPDEYHLYVVDRSDLDLFRAWRPEASEITVSEMNEYAYWLPAHARAADRTWRGGFPARPDGRQTLTDRGRTAVAAKLIAATEDGRIATAQLLDRWVRGVVPAAA